MFAVLQQASAFSRRILDPLIRFPYRLLLLGKNPDTSVCTCRIQVAKEILETKNLEINAAKARDLFQADLQFAATQGILKGALRVFIRGIARCWQCDTRDCERINKHLALFTERGPTSSHELISSRACIKHFLGESVNPGASEKRRKWSEYKPTAQSLLQLCLSSWPDKAEVQNNTSRWEQPAPPEDLPPDREMSRVYDKLIGIPGQTARKNWAACWNMMINKKLAAASESDTSVSAGSSLVVTIIKKQAGFQSTYDHYITAEKVRTTRRLVLCETRGDRELWLKEPLTFLNSLDVISSYWPFVRSGAHVRVFILKPNKYDAKNLPAIKYVGLTESKPIAQVDLEKPSTKMKEAFVNWSDEPEENEDEHAEHHEEDDANDNAEKPLEQKILELLMEQAEEDLEKAAGDDGGTHGSASVLTTAEHILREACRETTSTVLDDLEEKKQELETEANEETMEDSVRAVEEQVVKDALRTGACPMP